MDTMTQNTLADLRSMEHAIDDKKDRYLLGLCTLFVATIEEAKDRISQLELVFCSQLFPAFQTKLLESRQALQESEDLHKQALQQWQTSREELLREIQELRTDRETQILHLRQELQGLLSEVQSRAEEASKCKLELQEQSKFRKLEVDKLQQELSRLRRELNSLELQQVTNLPPEVRLREGLPGNEQEASLQANLVKLSVGAAELRQENNKFLQENHYIHEKSSQLCKELRSRKSKILSATPTVPDTSSDAKDLQLRLEQKSQERSLECFRRQLLSAEVEKERKATHAALVKLHALKKRYQSLRKQYTVLFRHRHTLQQLHHSEDQIGSSEHPNWHQESDCDSRLNVDKASQIELCSRSSLKVASHAKCDEKDEKTEVGPPDSSSLKEASSEDGNELDERTKDNLQDSTMSLEPLHPLENSQRKITEVANVRSIENGWLPVQKRASTIKDHRKAYKSLKTAWRNTRSRAEINGFDPHDDFLDTPQENILKNHSRNARHLKYEADAAHGDAVATNNFENKVLLTSIPEEEQLEGKKISFSQVTTQAPEPEADFAFDVNQSEKSNEHTSNEHSTTKNKPVNQTKEPDDGADNRGSDKRTKLLSTVTSNAKGLPVAKQGPMYKFVEPVRRKDEREKLQGIECNQCKKFYDAVLLNDAPGAVSGRCEHRDAVSRHRYRYVPPSTPEGFWNIGFDSEL